MGRKKVNQYVVTDKVDQDRRIANALQILELDGMTNSFKPLAEMAVHDRVTFFDYLETLLEKQLAFEEEKRIDRWICQAKFPFKKSIKDFEFSFQPTLDESQIRHLASCRFVEGGENIVFFGPPGVGKTHLSIAIGIEAIQRGYEVRFLGLDKFLNDIERTNEDAEASGKILRFYANPRLLILDDMDFYPTGKNGGTALFRLIDIRYKKGMSTILTSAREFSQWEGLFGANSRAAGAIDRLLERCAVINIDGKSYRVKDKIKLQVISKTGRQASGGSK